MGKLRTHTNISFTNNASEENFKQNHRSKLTLFKNLSTSQSSIENELICSKKNINIPSRYKTEEITLENLKPDIVCYNIETPSGGRGRYTNDAIKKNINKQNQPKDSNKKGNTPKSDAKDLQYPDQSNQKNTTEDDNKLSEQTKWVSSRTRLLHSILRPEDSKTSKIEIPDLIYVPSNEKLPKPKYPKNTPRPAFKPVGPYKCKIPRMTSKERLLLRKKLQKADKELEKLKEKESVLSIDAAQQSKFLKKKENIQYDIILSQDLEGDLTENVDNEPMETPHRKKSVASRLFKRFQKAPKSESEVEIIKPESEIIEQPKEPIPPPPVDDDDEEFEIEPEEEPEQEPEQELVELEPEEEPEQEPEQELVELEPEEKPEQEPEQELVELEPEEEPKQEPEQGLVKLEPEEEPEETKVFEEKLNKTDTERQIEEYFAKEPKERSIEPVEKIESQRTKSIEKQTSPIKVIHIERERIQSEKVKMKPKSKAELRSPVDTCAEKYNNCYPPCEALMSGIKPGSKKRIVFKECDSPMCKREEGKVNIGYSSRDRLRSVEIIRSDENMFPTSARLSRGSSNYNQMQVIGVTSRNHRSGSHVNKNLRNPIGNQSQPAKQELQRISRNSYGNRSKNNQGNRKTRKLKKSTYDSREVLYEKELQSYDYLTNRVSQNYQNLKPTDYNLVLDLNFQNKVTQTRYSQTKEKNMQTKNFIPCNQNQPKISVPGRNRSSSNYPYAKNSLQVQNGMDFKVIRNTPMGVPQLVSINYHTRNPKPNVDIIYKNTKYLAYPKYVKHENCQRISVDHRKHSYNNNLQYNSQNKNYKMLTYFVNIQEKTKDNNLQHSLNLKTVDRNLIIKLV